MENILHHRTSFEVFKSNICHLVKDMGDVDFLIDILEKNEVRKLYNRKWYPESLYLLAMIDYLSRENGIPVCTNYDDIRCQRLQETIYPTDILLCDEIMHTSRNKTESQEKAIPEFMRFNIVECNVRDVC